MTAVIDTNVLVRHLTQDDPVLGGRATQYLQAAGQRELILTAVVATEVVVVLQRYYRAGRPVIAKALRATLAGRQIRCGEVSRLHRAADLYELGADFVDAYSVAVAEEKNASLVTFDRRSTRNSAVRRVVP